MNKDNILICFCKHPEAGFVKTRLSKDIGENNAAKVYKRLLDTTLDVIGPLECKSILYCFPDSSHATFHEYEHKHHVILKNQHSGDLGTKMFHAIGDQLSNKTNAVLIGSDCPEIDGFYIKKAFTELNNDVDIVIGPAADGGYALLGANKIDPIIFKNIKWSSDQVLNKTKINLESIGWKYTLLEQVKDLDCLEDYQYFSSLEKYQHLFVNIND